MFTMRPSSRKQIRSHCLIAPRRWEMMTEVLFRLYFSALHMGIQRRRCTSNPADRLMPFQKRCQRIKISRKTGLVNLSGNAGLVFRFSPGQNHKIRLIFAMLLLIMYHIWGNGWENFYFFKFYGVFRIKLADVRSGKG